MSACIINEQPPPLLEALGAAAAHHCEGSFNSWSCKHRVLGELGAQAEPEDLGRQEKPGSTEETEVIM